MPARWSLQQTTLAPDSDETRAQGSFGLLTGGNISLYPLILSVKFFMLNQYQLHLSVKLHRCTNPTLLYVLLEQPCGTVGAPIHSNSAIVMSCYEDVMSVFYVYFMGYNCSTKLVCIA